MNNLILECNDLMKKSGTDYVINGGFALEIFANKVYRPHSDVDVTVFDKDRKNIVKFLLDYGWQIYEYQPKTLELIPIYSEDDERVLTLRFVWAVKPPCSLYKIEPKEGEEGVFTWDFLSKEQLNFDYIEVFFKTEQDGNFVCNKDKNIHRQMDKAILHKDDIPYLAPELALFLKSPKVYSEHEWHAYKTSVDYKTIVPLLDNERKDWLVNALKKIYPDGHGWLKI